MRLPFHVALAPTCQYALCLMAQQSTPTVERDAMMCTAAKPKAALLDTASNGALHSAHWAANPVSEASLAFQAA